MWWWLHDTGGHWLECNVRQGSSPGSRELRGRQELGCSCPERASNPCFERNRHVRGCCTSRQTPFPLAQQVQVSRGKEAKPPMAGSVVTAGMLRPMQVFLLALTSSFFLSPETERTMEGAAVPASHRGTHEGRQGDDAHPAPTFQNRGGPAPPNDLQQLQPLHVSTPQMPGGLQLLQEPQAAAGQRGGQGGRLLQAHNVQPGVHPKWRRGGLRRRS